jgi:SHS2 domain-containing protein
MTDNRFEIINQPSEVGIIAHGENLKETFENAAFGMFSLMAELADIEDKHSIEVAVKADDREELLINWLNELIFIETTKRFLIKHFKISKLTDKELKATVSGEKIKENLHELHRPIKSASYNQLELKEKRAKVIFDV